MRKTRQYDDGTTTHTRDRKRGKSARKADVNRKRERATKRAIREGR